MNFLDPLLVILASLIPQELARQVFFLNIESVSTRTLLLLCNPDIQSDVWATPRSASEQPVRQLPHGSCAEFSHLARLLFRLRDLFGPVSN